MNLCNFVWHMDMKACATILDAIINIMRIDQDYWKFVLA